jgi:predicted  nucleic acid-binding Zn-ribbon protein
MTTKEDIASVAAQLAGLTKTVERMSGQLTTLRQDAASQHERSDTQEDRINIATRELAEVSERLQAAANALRQSMNR